MTDQIANLVGLPADFTAAHLAAILFLVASWLAYAPLLGFFARGTLNNQLDIVRLQWMERSTGRNQRPFDAILLGLITNSVSFFGSATLIILAALLGAFANVGKIHEAVQGLPLIDSTSRELFALNLGVILSLMVISFFSFTYSLRKLIYTVALVGGLPEKSQQHKNHEILVEAAATVLTQAVRSFNSGIRGFYYTVAALCLFIDAYAAICATLLVMGMLFYRQTATQTSDAIGRFVTALDDRS